MSKAPDLSAFPIPRKGGARPLAGDHVEAAGPGGGEGGGFEPSAPMSHPAAASSPVPIAAEPASGAKDTSSTAARATRTNQPLRAPIPPPPTYGQTVATTVKLDENRYLRLMEAGKPGPGRLRRRTIQDMLIEALDEWFERRHL